MRFDGSAIFLLDSMTLSSLIPPGRTIYEWEQSLDEVNIYINPPEGDENLVMKRLRYIMPMFVIGVTAKLIDCKITASHFKLGIKGNPPYMDVMMH